MKSVYQLDNELRSGVLNQRLCWLYSCTSEEAWKYALRYCDVLSGLEQVFGTHDNAALFSAPGRTEIGGNHTDHQHGRVLAGAVNMDMIAAVSFNGLNEVRLHSEGYSTICIDLACLEKQITEENTSAAIVRGTCAAFRECGAKLQGLDIYVASNVPKGSGVSSSAAFEVLIGTILNELFMAEKVSAVEIAKIGQWVENVYFGKPCGLMDQMASSVGGIVGIDFADPACPVVESLNFDIGDAGLALCIIDSGADHADLTDEYAAVPAECCSVAKVCGADVLRNVPYDKFLEYVNACRAALGDRAVLRAMHFYADNDRVAKQIEALRQKDYVQFLTLVTDSGHSSWEYLQNISPAGAVKNQAVAFTIAIAKAFLADKGAVRVHGGGFAGTVQAFVPLDMVADFCRKMDAQLGVGHCKVMAIRPVGGIRLN